jgi:hypothetical protein
MFEAAGEVPMSVAVSVLGGRSGGKLLLLAAPGHGKGKYDANGGCVAVYIRRILRRFLLNTGIQSVTTAPSNRFLGNRQTACTGMLGCSAN